MFYKVVSHLWFFSVLKLTISQSQSSKIQRRHCSWTILPFVYVQSPSYMHRDLCNCVNSAQDLVSKNGFKFSTGETVCMHFCNQRKPFAEPSISWYKSPIKVVTEATFLGVIFGGTLAYNSHVNYLKTNCLKAVDILKVVDHTDLGADR